MTFLPTIIAIMFLDVAVWTTTFILRRHPNEPLSDTGLTVLEANIATITVNVLLTVAITAYLAVSR